jgi:ubiquinone/menaquinone biosynthesis C-methylase UbiE
MKGAHCYAVDISAMMLQVVQRLAERFGVELRTHVMPAEELDFDDNAFDYVYAANLLHQLDPADALSEMRRVTEPGEKSVSGTHSNTIP